MEVINDVANNIKITKMTLDTLSKYNDEKHPMQVVKVWLSKNCYNKVYLTFYETPKELSIGGLKQQQC